MHALTHTPSPFLLQATHLLCSVCLPSDAGVGPASMAQRRSCITIEVPKATIGRVVGKDGATIKALQSYTSSLIQIDQTVDPVRITISGTPHALNLAVSMIQDVVRGTFKGFALLRQSTLMNSGAYPGQQQQPAARPVYAPGYGLIPPSQIYGTDAAPQALNAAAFQAAPGALPRLGMGMGMQQPATYHYFQQPQMAPSQLVMQGLQPMPLNSVGLLGGAAMYNIGGTAYSGPVFYSAQDYAAATGGLGEPSAMFYADATGASDGPATPSALLGHGGSANAKLLHAAGSKAAMSVAAGASPGQRSLVPKGMGGDHHAVNMLVGSSGAQQAAAGSPSTAGGLVGGSLVMDSEGQLYTYGLGEAR